MPKDVYDEFDDEFYSDKDMVSNYVGGGGAKRVGSALEARINDYINSGGEPSDDSSVKIEKLPIEVKNALIDFFELMSLDRSKKIAELAKVIKSLLESLV